MDVAQWFIQTPFLVKVVAGILSVGVIPLVAIIYKNQIKRIESLELAVQQMGKDVPQKITRGEFEEHKDKVYSRIKEVEYRLGTKIDARMDSLQGQLQQIQDHLLRQK